MVGSAEWGERLVEAARREVYEETGLTPEIGGVLDVMSYLPRPQLHVIQLVFEVEAQGEPKVIEVDGSTADVGWFPTHAVASMPTVPLVDHLLQLRGW